MLTLFDYLRQRAFDAVMDGTHDALEYLDGQQGTTKSDPSRYSQAGDGPPVIDRQPGSSDGSQPDGSREDDAQSKKVLPPPRRRGRPRKNQSPVK